MRFPPCRPAARRGTSPAPAALAAVVVLAAHPTAAQELQRSWEGPVASWFGYAVAGGADLDGDGVADVVVGAPNDYDRERAGRVYAYSGATGDGLWGRRGATPHDRFGAAVAPAGDVDGDGVADLLIGAFHDDNAAGARAGSATVLSGVDGSALWRWEGRFDGHQLGWAVAGAGDVDGDGHADPAVGVPGFRRVYVYSGRTGEALLELDGSYGFGTAVAGGDDLDGDGVADVVVGAPFAPAPTGEPVGAAYAFSGATGELSWLVLGRNASDGFGSAVDSAPTPDGVAVAVGAEFASSRGRAALLRGDDGAPRWSRYGPEPDARFGAAVAHAGDVDADGSADLLVGAPGRPDPFNVDTGRAYLYAAGDGRTLASWVAEDVGSEFGDHFGHAVSRAGDTDGDGIDDLLIGAYLYSGEVPGDDNGKVYLYSGNAFLTGELSAEAACLATCPNGRVAYRLSGVNSRNDAVVLGLDLVDPEFARLLETEVPPGAFDVVGEAILPPDWPPGGECPERARLLATLFDPSAGGVQESLTVELVEDTGLWQPRRDTVQFDQPLHVWDGAGPHDTLGTAVAGAGDVDGDGRADLLLGAPQWENAAAEEVGQAYLYSGSDAALLYTWTGSRDEEGFGGAVAGVGDADGDGIPDVAVGMQPSPLLIGFGGAHVYSGATGDLLWVHQGETDRDVFSWAVNGAEDFDRDGLADVVVGAYRHDGPAGDDTGKAYVYAGPTGELLAEWTGSARNQRLGWSVAGVGDLQADGRVEVGMTAPGTHPGGAAYVYSGNGLLARTWEGATEDDHVGSDIAAGGLVDGDAIPDVLVGASGGRYEDDPGRATIYSGTLGLPIHEWELSERRAGFGEAVAGAGDANGDGSSDLLVAAPFEDGPRPVDEDQGRVYLYSGRTGALLHDWPGEGPGLFGDAVAVPGDTDGDGVDDLLIGAPAQGGGRAYLYAGSRFLGSGIRADGSCLTLCPRPDFLVRVSGDNTSGDVATVVVEIVEPDTRTVVDVEVEPGPFEVVEHVRLPARFPPRCPDELRFTASVLDRYGGTVEESFTIDVAARAP